MLKIIWFQIHWFIGITAGVILAVVGLTGGILSFESEIQDYLNREVRRVAVQEGQPLTPAALVTAAERQQPGKRVTGVQVYSNPGQSSRVTFAASGGQHAEGGGGGGGRGGARGEQRFANPYTGELLVGPNNRGQAFFRNTRSLHRWLVVGEGDRAIGKQLVGASTLLCVVLALSGLYLRWPRHVSDWRAWFTFDPALKGRSFLWHLHAVLGTWVLIGFLLMSLTGLQWSYNWYRDGLYKIAGVERPQQREGGAAQAAAGGERRERGGEGGGGAAHPDLDTVWNVFRMQTAETGYTSATLNFPQARRPVEISYLDADPAHERANNTMAIDASTAMVVRHARYDDKRTGEKLIASIFPLHSGSFFGLPGLILYMIASLAMPVFAVTGWMLYLDRRKKKRAALAARGNVQPPVVRPGATAAGPREPLLLGFASQAGFARQLAWQTAGSLQAAGFDVDVQPLERLDAEKLSHAKRALFVVSTFGEGEPPDAARAFARRLRRDNVSLGDLKFGLLALGDRQYKTFCEFGRTLDSWLKRQGAQPVFPLVEVDKSDPQALARWRERLGELTGGVAVQPWVEETWGRWQLKERRLLNPQSVGGPTFHLAFDATGQAPWNAGDIVVVQPGDSADQPVREFSAASIPADGELHLVVRQARKPDGTLGIGSGWLTEAINVGDVINLRVRSNPSFHAPEDDRPLLLIGNGTGIAGLRSLLKARALQGAGNNWLIFGERNSAHDLYYRDELIALQERGLLLRADYAFSRDQPERIYVQQRLRERAAELREWLAAGAAIYVCGSAEGMAPAVHATLVDLVGEPVLEKLIEEGRYRRDVY